MITPIKTLRRNYAAATIAVIVLSILVKTIFIFHGRWDAAFFVPYNTDETFVLNFTANYLNNGHYDTTGLLGIGYLTFLHNFFFAFFVLCSLVTKFLGLTINHFQQYELMAYCGRFLIVLFSVLFSVYAWATFGRLLSSRRIRILYLILLNFNVLFFSYSSYLKFDFIVAALGFISIYYGLKYFDNQTNYNYLKFGLAATLAAAGNFYGYVYILNFILVTLYTKKTLISNGIIRVGTLLLMAIVFISVNWQYVFFWKESLKMSPLLNGKFDTLIPFATNADGLNSGIWYLSYATDLFGLAFTLLAAIGVYLCLKSSAFNTYYRLLLVSFLIYFTHLSFSAYRTDRLLIPFVAIGAFLMLFNFDYLITKNSANRRAQFAVYMMLLVLIVIPTIYRTSVYAKSVLQPDTRQVLYEWLEKKLHKGEAINFLHLSISGAFSVAQKIGDSNDRGYLTNVVYLDKNEQKNIERGYVILSAIDYLTLKKYRNIYPEQLAWVEKLMNKNIIVEFINNNNFNDQPFGSLALLPSNSLYGFRNPPFYIIKIIENIVLKKQSSIPPAPQNNLINRSHGWDVSESNGEDANTFEITNRNIKIDFSNGKIFAVSPGQSYVRLSLSYAGTDFGYGFSSQRYTGQAFTSSVWAQSSGPYCTRVGFYRGNIGSIGWGDYNFSDEKDRFELISYTNRFDDPYTLNGNLFLEVAPGCAVEFANPIVVVND